jgi:hypothetical protein
MRCPSYSSISACWLANQELICILALSREVALVTSLLFFLLQNSGSRVEIKILCTAVQKSIVWIPASMK